MFLTLSMVDILIDFARTKFLGFENCSLSYNFESVVCEEKRLEVSGGGRIFI